jgi:hypothetical protein
MESLEEVARERMGLKLGSFSREGFVAVEASEVCRVSCSSSGEGRDGVEGTSTGGFSGRSPMVECGV